LNQLARGEPGPEMGMARGAANRRWGPAWVKREREPSPFPRRRIPQVRPAPAVASAAFFRLRPGHC